MGHYWVSFYAIYTFSKISHLYSVVDLPLQQVVHTPFARHALVQSLAQSHLHNLEALHCILVVHHRCRNLQVETQMKMPQGLVQRLTQVAFVEALLSCWGLEVKV